MNIAADTKVKDFFAKYGTFKYAKGQVLLANGERCYEVMYLLKGKVKVYDVTYRGEEIILNVFKPQSFFPMSLALNPDSINMYIYEAESDVEMLKAPATEVVAFLHSNSDVLLDLVNRLYSGVDGLLGRMANLMAGSAKSRLIYELIIEARRFGKQQPNGSYILTISEKDLGARAGLSRETISREMHKLKDEKLVVLNGKHIHLTSVDALKALL